MLVYQVSEDILDHELGRVDSLKEVQDTDLFDEWLTVWRKPWQIADGMTIRMTYMIVIHN